MKFKHFQKLMIIAGTTLITSLNVGNVLAQSQDNLTSFSSQEQTVVNHINNLIDQQYKNNTLSHKMKVNIKELKDKYADNDNSLDIKNGECELNVAFTRDDKTVKLVQEEETLKITSLKNEVQKQFAQDFITLHEAAHCEFETIKNPVQDFSKDSKFNEQLNHSLRDFWNTLSQNSENNYIHYNSYNTFLNETYADVNAVVGLIKSNSKQGELQSGKVSSDLNYVINSIITQREVNFITRVAENKIADSHYSSEALKELMKPENLKKIEALNDNEDIKKFVLELSNKGTQKALASNQKLKNSAFSVKNEENITNIISATLSTIKDNNKISLEDAINEATMTLKGFDFSSNSKKLITALLKNEDLKGLEGLSDKDIYDKAIKISDKKNSVEEINDFLYNNKVIREFRQDVEKENPNTININKENVQELVTKAHKDFIEKTTEIKEYKIDKINVTSKISELRNKAFGNEIRNTNKLTIN